MTPVVEAPQQAIRRLRGRKNADRPESDAYWTRPEMVEALLDADPDWPEPIWEPAAGGGHIVGVLRGRGLSVVASDLHDHGAGFESGIDFCAHPRPIGHARSILTNPPFALCAQAGDYRWLRQVAAVLRDSPWVAKIGLLLPSTYLHGQFRSALLAPWLRQVWLFRGRHSLYPAYAGGGPTHHPRQGLLWADEAAAAPYDGDTGSSTTIDYAWFILGRASRPAPCELGWLAI